MREENERPRPVAILLIEDNPGNAELITGFFRAAGQIPFTCEVKPTLAEGVERLSRGGIDLVLLDLGLPDSEGLRTFEQIYDQFSEYPLVIVSGAADEELAVRMVRKGAQDYLVKGSFDRVQLIRSVRYALERHKIKAEIRSLSLIDELTGIYNRRGFFTVANQQIQIARRLRKKLLLLYGDMDQLKWINDTFGHAEGDRAIREVAQIFRLTFRASDLIARMGGDEFAVLGIEEDQADFQKITERLRHRLASRLFRGDDSYRLSLSIGMVRFDPESLERPEDLLVKADQLMYREKIRKKSPS